VKAALPLLDSTKLKRGEEILHSMWKRKQNLPLWRKAAQENDARIFFVIYYFSRHEIHNVI
jgi:hypothetical protein